jgi:hypothetical protein
MMATSMQVRSLTSVAVLLATWDCARAQDVALATELPVKPGNMCHSLKAYLWPARDLAGSNGTARGRAVQFGVPV